MVLAPVIHGLLLLADELPRLAPPPFQPGPAEREVLVRYCRSGSWEMERPAERVDAVRDAVYTHALARLSARDALLIGLVPTAGGMDPALRLLDLDETTARQVLLDACRALERAVWQVVDEHLQRRPPVFSRN
jgi:hypothetical protein